jgi:hypothetical protein
VIGGIGAKFATRVRPAVTVNVYDALVDATTPFSVQFANEYPLAGVAVTVALLP